MSGEEEKWLRGQQRWNFVAMKYEGEVPAEGPEELAKAGMATFKTIKGEVFSFERGCGSSLRVSSAQKCHLTPVVVDTRSTWI